MKRHFLLVAGLLLVFSFQSILADQASPAKFTGQIAYDDGIPAPNRDLGDDWITYDDGNPSGLITGAPYWSKVHFTPVSRFTLEGISVTPLNQGPNFEDQCRVRVYSLTNNLDIDEMLYEFEIDRLNEWGENAEHVIELDRNDFIEFNAEETFAIMYEAPGGPYNPGQEGAGWWNLYDGANNAHRSFYNAIDEFGDAPSDAHEDWTETAGDLLLRANGTYQEGFVDLEITELYTESMLWMVTPGTEQTFTVDIVNNGGDVDDFIVEFGVLDSQMDEIWSDEVHVRNGIDEGDEMSVDSDDTWEAPDDLGNYYVFALVSANNDANDENDAGALDQIVFEPGENPDQWVGYTDGEFESTTAWNEDSGWAVAFHHPGGNAPALALPEFRVAIFAEEVVECDFMIHIWDLDAEQITEIWSGTAETQAGGINWVAVEPDWEEDVAIEEGQAFLVSYLYNNETRFPEDQTLPFAGTNNVMPWVMLQTQDDGGAYQFANGGDFPIEAKLRYTDWMPEGAHLFIDPEVVDFGFGLRHNRDYTIVVTLESYGTEDINIRSIEIPRGAQDYLSVDPDGDIDIPSGESTEIEFTFNTNEDTELDTRVLIRSNDDDNPNQFITILASTEEPQDFPKRVLLENFTSSTCPPCAQLAPNLQAALGDVEDMVIPIGYHVWWPGDSDPWYRDNPDQVRDLVNMYGVRGVPSLFLDGNILNARDRNGIRNAIEDRAENRTPVEINLMGMLDNDVLSVNASVRSFENYDNAVLRVALKEDEVDYRGTNGLPTHHDAMVRMIPDAQGEQFDINAGQRLNFEFELDMDGVGWHELDPENLYLAAWLVEGNRNILQATNFYLGEPPAPPVMVTDPEDGDEIAVEMAVDDHPIEEEITISNTADQGAMSLTWDIDVDADWIDINNDHGSLAAGESDDVVITFMAEDLEAGEFYQDELVITSNDPDNGRVEITLSLQVTGGVPDLRHWQDFTITDASHSVLINQFTFDDEDVPVGWEIGVFTPDGVLAGASVWEAEPTGIAAWADDQDTEDIVEGFHVDESMSFRVWDDVNDVEYSASAQVIAGGGGEQRPLAWAPNGFTVIVLSAAGTREVSIDLHEGWNMISININPVADFFEDEDDEGADVILMFEQLDTEDGHLVRLVKDELGHFYSPDWNFNNIPFWNVTQGYQVKMNEPAEATWMGMPIEANADVPLENGWNIIAYFPQYDLDASAPDFYVLSPIIEQVLMAKDWQGQFLNPQFRFSNMDDWTEGQGYQVKVEGGVVLNYPEEEQMAGAAVNNRDSQPVVAPTGNGMNVLVNHIEGIQWQTGDMIYAYNTSDQPVGAGQIDEDGRCGVAVWGDDESTDAVDGLIDGEAFTLRYFDDVNQQWTDIQSTKTLEGNGLQYEIDGFSVVEASAAALIPESIYLEKAYPNPFNMTAVVPFGIPEDGVVSINVYDLSGRLVAELVNGQINAGNHRVVWQAGDAPAGMYLVRMESMGSTFSQKITLMK